MSKALNIGVIGIRGASSTESLSEQLKRKGVGGEVLELQEIAYDLGAGGNDFHHELDKFDGLIVKKLGKHYSANLLDQIELLALLERRGIRFFSSPIKIRKMISRLSCTLGLWENNIPMPPTFMTESLEAAIDWVEARGAVVMKPLYSTKARGMALIHNADETRTAVQNLFASGEKIIYLQKKLDLSGTDYGLVFLGGDYIGAYARVGDGSSWHTTTRQGGKYAAFEPGADMIALAKKANAIFDLDFACVDIAVTKELGSVVFEVSAFGAYRGLSESSGIDAADLLTDYAIKQLQV